MPFIPAPGKRQENQEFKVISAYKILTKKTHANYWKVRLEWWFSGLEASCSSREPGSNSQHAGQHTTICNYNFKRSDVLCWPLLASAGTRPESGAQTWASKAFIHIKWKLLAVVLHTINLSWGHSGLQRSFRTAAVTQQNPVSKKK